jgi:IMP cyclohydrolase
MNNQWPQLKDFIYPGRFLIIGQTSTSYYIVYGVTARSEASRAKKYIFNRAANTILVEPIDFEKMSQGNLDLLSYNAVHIYGDAIVAGNGQQTDLIKSNTNAAMSLVSNLQQQSFEPDSHNTPRITGALQNNNGQISSALHIIKANQEGQTEQEAYALSLSPGQAYFLSTYAGANIKPTPSFASNPILLEIDFADAQAAAQQIYNHFAPQTDQPDLRVSVMAVETDLELKEKVVTIINYHK